MSGAPVPGAVRRFLRLVSGIVPRDRRADWRRQWEAEVAHFAHRRKGWGSVAGFALGAVPHAIHLRRREGVMRGWGMDLRHTVRALLHRPAFTLVAIGTLGLGIGIGTAVFSLAEALVLRPLPLPESDRLVRVFTQNPERQTGWYSVSYPDFDALEATAAFAGRSFYRVTDRDVSGSVDPERLRVAEVHDGFFETLGTTALRGRLLGGSDQAATADPTVVLSEALWVRRYGADPALVGRVVRLDGVQHTVVGIAPDDGAWPVQVDAWVPLAWGGTPPDWADSRANHTWQVVGRLQPDVTLAGASTRVRELSLGLYAASDVDPRDVGTELLLVPLRASEGGEGAGQLFATLGAAVFLIVLLACMNASGLFLSRGWARARELSVRAALGAGRLRIAVILLGESLVLAVVAGVVGAGAGVWAIERAFRSTPPELRAQADISLNGTVLFGALAISVLAALLAGSIPAWTGSRAALASAMKEGGGAGRGRRATRIRRGLVVAEVAVSLSLLVSAGLAVDGFQKQLSSDAGFEVDDVWTFTVRLPASRYADEDATTGFFDEAVARLEAHPGLRTASATSRLPLGAGGLSLYRVLAWEGALPPEGPEFGAHWVEVDPEWFATLGVPTTEGRPFTRADDAAGQPVAILSRRLATQMSGDADVVGRSLRSIYDENLPRTVVGVVDDLQINGVARPTAAPIVLVPRSQAPARSMAFLVRADGEPEQTVAAIRSVIGGLDADVAVHDLRTLSDAHAADLSGIRFLSGLFAAFGAVALLLAVTGVYGLVSMSVARRVREIGVRMAMGATASGVRLTVLRESLGLGLIGLVLGSGLAWMGARALSAGFAGIARPSIAGVAIVAGVLVAGVLAGAWVPARRATRITPVDALRVD